MIAPPYTARQCPICEQWVYCADGPFAEDPPDPTKTLADYQHWVNFHADPPDLLRKAFGFPFFTWNDTPVEAVKEA